MFCAIPLLAVYVTDYNAMSGLTSADSAIYGREMPPRPQGQAHPSASEGTEAAPRKSVLKESVAQTVQNRSDCSGFGPDEPADWGELRV